MRLTASPTDRRALLRRASALLLLVVTGMLAGRTMLYLASASAALRFPFQLDYGEGIVWEQMRLIAAGRGYAPIAGFPAIVFHYPPLYHLLTGAIARLSGADELFTGRAVSLTCTIVTAGLVARLGSLLAPREADRTVVRAGALLTALIVLAMLPTEIWSVLMRVDMLCMALTFGGLLCGMLAVTRPRAVYLAAVLFVAAIYTKQTALAAPAAVFATLLVLRPRTALAGIAATITLGLVELATLTAATDGGVLRHIVLYNINRIDLTTLIAIPRNIEGHFAFVMCGVMGVTRELLRLRANRAGTAGSSLITHLRSDPRDARVVMALLHCGAATLMLGLLAKSGASDNYLIEWDCSIALFAGLALRDAGTAAFRPTAALQPSWLSLMIPATLLLQGYHHPRPDIWSAQDLRSHYREGENLVAMIAAAPQPVISDDMVAVLRAGKAVLWEPAIFAELGATGVWDETPLLERIRARQFAFILANGPPGSPLYQSRHTPAVTQAIAAAYPVQIKAGGSYLFFPAGPLPAYALRLDDHPR